MPLPIVFWIVGAVATTATATAAAAATDNLRRKRLNVAVVGPKEAGKTKFIEILKNGKADLGEYITTVYDTYEQEFEAFWTKENLMLRTDITINNCEKEILQEIFPKWCPRGGKDVNGNRYIGPKSNGAFKKLVDNSNFVFYLFDINMFITDSSSREACLDRFDFMYRILNESQRSKFRFIGTHLDTLKKKSGFSDLQKIQTKYKKFVENKIYTHFVLNINYMNLGDPSAGTKIRNLFGEAGK